MKRIEMDYSKRCWEEQEKVHNRWHPDIPPALEVEPEEEVYLQTRDALDGQITPESTLADVPGIDGGVVHPMTGPVYVKGAKPGDLLEIEIIDIVPGTFGFTGILPHFGFLSDLFTDPFLVKWSMDGKHAVSEQLPGVRIPEASFMGTIGVAPSRAAMEEWRDREARAAEAGGVAEPPDKAGAVPTWEPVASEGLRTIPPRENGGNMDIKQLTKGVRLLCPMFVDGGDVLGGGRALCTGRRRDVRDGGGDGYGDPCSISDKGGSGRKTEHPVPDIRGGQLLDVAGDGGAQAVHSDDRDAYRRTIGTNRGI